MECSDLGCTKPRKVGTKCLKHMKYHIQTTIQLEKYLPSLSSYRLELEAKVADHERAQKTA